LEFGVLSDFDLDFWESSILLFAAIDWDGEGCRYEE